MSTVLLNKVAGVIYGTAIGDALGYPIEFIPIEHRPEKFQNGLCHYPQLVNGVALYSDDTQMMRAVLEGALKVDNVNSFEQLTAEVKQEFIAWFLSPENNRAPGNACLSGCRELAKGVVWQTAGNVSALGSGAAMRSMAYSLIFPDSPHTAGMVAAQHARMTHGHPGAQEAAYITAMSVGLLVNGYSIDEMLRVLDDYNGLYCCETQCNIWNWMIEAVNADDFQKALKAIPGWRSDHAIAAALACFVRNGGRYQRAITSAVLYCGDSDTVGAITGALAGAYNGADNLPQDLLLKVEKQEELGRLAVDVVQKVIVNLSDDDCLLCDGKSGCQESVPDIDITKMDNKSLH